MSHFSCKTSLSFSIAGYRSIFLAGCSIELMASRYTALRIDFRLLLIINLRWLLGLSLRDYVCLFALEVASTNKGENSAFFPSLLAEILSRDSYSWEELLGSFKWRFMLCKCGIPKIKFECEAVVFQSPWLNPTSNQNKDLVSKPPTAHTQPAKEAPTAGYFAPSRKISCTTGVQKAVHEA